MLLDVNEEYSVVFIGFVSIVVWATAEGHAACVFYMQERRKCERRHSNLCFTYTHNTVIVETHQMCHDLRQRVNN